MWQPGKDCRLFGRDHYQPKDPRSNRRRHEAGAHNVLLISPINRIIVIINPMIRLASDVFTVPFSSAMDATHPHRHVMELPK